MTEAQEKNHTDPIELSSRTPLGQLMRRAVEYTHQTGADGTNAPLPSRKKILVIFGSPLVCSIVLAVTIKHVQYKILLKFYFLVIHCGSILLCIESSLFFIRRFENHFALWPVTWYVQVVENFFH